MSEILMSDRFIPKLYFCCKGLRCAGARILEYLMYTPVLRAVDSLPFISISEFRNESHPLRKVLLGLLSAMFFMSVCDPLSAATSEKEKQQSLTSSQMKEAVYLDAMSIPCPGEIFAAINKVSRPNWATLDRDGTAPVTTRRAQLALAVGVLVTNGYIAVEAQDGQQVKNIGRDIMTMAKALGVSQSILGRGNNLIQFADQNEWDELRDELEATENEVKITMIDQQDKNLVALTSAGAWIRGLQVASNIIANHYSLQGAALLNEPDLALRLAADLEALPEKLRMDPLVISTKATLTMVASLLKKEPHGLSKEALQLVQRETGKVVTAIITSDAAAGGVSPNATAEVQSCVTRVLAASSTSVHSSAVLLAPCSASPAADLKRLFPVYSSATTAIAEMQSCVTPVLAKAGYRAKIVCFDQTQE